jgi:hypothetical protein
MATEFLLKDDTGKTRAWLVVREDGPGLHLLDETGKRRAMLTVTKDGPALVLLDETGKVIRSYP